MLRIVAPRTRNLIYFTLRTHPQSTAKQWHTSGVMHITRLAHHCFARVATARSIMLRVRIWAASFQSFNILSLSFTQDQAIQTMIHGGTIQQWVQNVILEQYSTTKWC
jgi:hypothetical protein